MEKLSTITFHLIVNNFTRVINNSTANSLCHSPIKINIRPRQIHPQRLITPLFPLLSTQYPPPRHPQHSAPLPATHSLSHPQFSVPSTLGLFPPPQATSPLNTTLRFFSEKDFSPPPLPERTDKPADTETPPKKQNKISANTHPQASALRNYPANTPETRHTNSRPPSSSSANSPKHSTKLPQTFSPLFRKRTQTSQPPPADIPSRKHPLPPTPPTPKQKKGLPKNGKPQKKGKTLSYSFLRTILTVACVD